STATGCATTSGWAACRTCPFRAIRTERTDESVPVPAQLAVAGDGARAAPQRARPRRACAGGMPDGRGWALLDHLVERLVIGTDRDDSELAARQCSSECCAERHDDGTGDRVEQIVIAGRHHHERRGHRVADAQRLDPPAARIEGEENPAPDRPAD